jgi:hypothetical protein
MEEDFMTEKKVTIQSILTEDIRKHLAEMLLNNTMAEMVVISREGEEFQCHSSTGVTANIIGMLELAKTLALDNWLHPEIGTDCPGEDDEEHDS